jgi:two-component system nitrate/nitrite response regulator NarL
MGEAGDGPARYDGVRVLLLGQRTLFTEALGWVLESYGMVTDVPASGESPLDAVCRYRPHLVLVDVEELPDEAARLVPSMVRESPETKLMAVTARYDPDALSAALGAGFHGYLTKDTPLTRFARLVDAALSGEALTPWPLGPGPAVGPNGDRPTVARLTAREREVLSLLALGASGGAIARRLGISPNTVRTHVRSVLAKLHCHTRLEAATYAVRVGLVSSAGRPGSTN